MVWIDAASSKRGAPRAVSVIAGTISLVKRWARVVLDLLSGVLLPLAIVSLVVALRGAWYQEIWGWAGRGRSFQFCSNWGSVSLCASDGPLGHVYFRQKAWPGMPWELNGEGPISRRYDWAGFAYAAGRHASYTSVRPMYFRLWVAPSWFLPLAFGILPAWWLPRRFRDGRARRRRARGQCGKCGYDVRATSGRCPECGTVATRPYSGTDTEDVDREVSAFLERRNTPCAPNVGA